MPTPEELERARPNAPRLSVTVPEVSGCSVVLDGVNLGATPIVERQAVAGTHQLVVRCPDGRHLQYDVTLTLGTLHEYSFHTDELRNDR